jgi:energy-coupling factor transporter transmembrane protein EcfT
MSVLYSFLNIAFAILGLLFFVLHVIYQGLETNWLLVVLLPVLPIVLVCLLLAVASLFEKSEDRQGACTALDKHRITNEISLGQRYCKMIINVFLGVGFLLVPLEYYSYSLDAFVIVYLFSLGGVYYSKASKDVTLSNRDFFFHAVYNLLYIGACAYIASAFGIGTVLLATLLWRTIIWGTLFLTKTFSEAIAFPEGKERGIFYHNEAFHSGFDSTKITSGFIANKRTKVYHHLHCPRTLDIIPLNRVHLETESDACEYRGCQQCVEKRVEEAHL